MATSTLPDNKQDQDKQYNPGEKQANKTFNGNAAAGLGQLEAYANDPKNHTQPDGPLGEKEAAGNLNYTGTPIGARERAPADDSRSVRKVRLFARIWGSKKRGPLAAIIFALGLSGLGAGYLGILAAPIAFIDTVMNDLNDVTAAADFRSGHLMRNKIPSSQRDRALVGCTVLSIRCKFRTLSPREVERLRIAGFEIDGERHGNRIKPTTYRFKGGTAMSPEEFERATRTDREIKNAYRRANNMKFLTLDDKSFNQGGKKFNTSKRTVLRGSHQDKVNQLMTRAQVNDIVDIKFTPVPGTESDPRYTLDGDSDGHQFTEDEKAKAERSIKRVAGNRITSTRVGVAGITALSVLGYWDIACTIKNMLGGAAVAAKVANAIELAQYAMPIASLAHQMKAGDISAEDAEVLGKFFMDADNRKKITDLHNSFTDTGDGENFQPRSDGIPEIDNPSYGKTVMDSPLLAMSNGHGVATPTVESARYSVGMGQNSLLGGISEAASISNLLLNLGSADNQVCRIVQNWLVRGVGLVVGVALGVSSGGLAIAANLAMFVGMFIAMTTLDNMINAALSGSVVDDGIKDAPLERAAATWTGLGVIQGQNAQIRGMMPGNTEQLLTYNKLRQESNATYLALELEGIDQFDPTNHYSFLGSFLTQLSSLIKPINGAGSLLANSSSVVSGGIGAVLKPATTFAAANDPERFNQCDDELYLKVGINPDVQCNVRYVMPAEDLALETDDVALYMEEAGYVATDTTTGLPPGYSPPEPAQSQGFALDTLNGFVNTYFDTRAATYNGNEYAMYLDYCVYRSLPYGETYEEGTQLNGVDADYLNGKKCMEQGAPYSYFRIYTFDRSIQEALDNEPIESVSSSNGTVVSPVAEGHIITSVFGPRDPPPCKECNRYHQATDLISSVGNLAVFSIMDGVVVNKGVGKNNVLSIKHPNGLISQYWHMAPSDVLVNIGDTVVAGQRIGTMGKTGQATGIHLHIELDVSQINDPAEFAQFARNPAGNTPGQRINPAEFFKSYGIAGF